MTSRIPRVCYARSCSRRRRSIRTAPDAPNTTNTTARPAITSHRGSPGFPDSAVGSNPPSGSYRTLNTSPGRTPPSQPSPSLRSGEISSPSAFRRVQRFVFPSSTATTSAWVDRPRSFHARPAPTPPATSANAAPARKVGRASQVSFRSFRGMRQQAGTRKAASGMRKAHRSQLGAVMKDGNGTTGADHIRPAITAIHARKNGSHRRNTDPPCRTSASDGCSASMPLLGCAIYFSVP